MTNRPLFHVFQVLLFCFIAAGLGFVTACGTAALLQTPFQRPEEVVRGFMVFILYGAAPCGIMGTVLALLAWALLPRAARLVDHWFPRPTGVATAMSPVTPAVAARFTGPPRPALGAGILTGTLLSFLNIPGYLCVGAVGVAAAFLSFVGAGMVAGVFLAWCRFHAVDSASAG